MKHTQQEKPRDKWTLQYRSADTRIGVPSRFTEIPQPSSLAVGLRSPYCPLQEKLFLGRLRTPHTHTHTHTQKHTKTHRDTQRHTKTHTNTHTHRDTERHTETHRHTQTHTERSTNLFDTMLKRAEDSFAD